MPQPDPSASSVNEVCLCCCGIVVVQTNSSSIGQGKTRAFAGQYLGPYIPFFMVAKRPDILPQSDDSCSSQPRTSSTITAAIVRIIKIINLVEVSPASRPFHFAYVWLQQGCSPYHPMRYHRNWSDNTSDHYFTIVSYLTQEFSAAKSSVS